jgi:hypothetical protein
MKVLTVRLPEQVEKKLRLKAKLEHRTLSEQISKYIHDAILCEENADLPYAFIKETLQAKAEIQAGFGQEYPFGILK